ncbi:hypothetical protein D1007_56836 [Hordeum vulgare]|nr:hypothetical protein D1007_56836 [Hordeum vulgare]
MNYGRRPPPAFERRVLEEYEHELAARRIRSSGSSTAGSSSAGTSSSRTITLVKRRQEELGPLTVKLEDDVVPLRGGVIGPEDYPPQGQEDLRPVVAVAPVIFGSLGSETSPPHLRLADLDRFITTRSQSQAHAHLAAMDPAIQTFLERLDNTLMEHTVAIHASNAKVDDLLA